MTSRALSLALAVVLAALTPAELAAQTADIETQHPEARPLYAALAEAEDQATADRLAGQIWEIWLTAPDETAQELLDSAMRRRRARDFLGAIRVLDRLIDSYPGYAEGWNQRATIRFLVGNYEGSLEDVAEVLDREPRHFGALSGKALILFQLGQVPLAQLTLRQALEYHPYLRERALLEVGAGTDL